MSASDTCVLISQGAEAKVYEIDFLDHPAILKQRFKKNYRLPELDSKITTRRILQEARSIYRCMKAGISTPKVYHVNPEKSLIIMEKIVGISIKKYLQAYGALVSERHQEHIKETMKQIGTVIAKMHELNIIHGDLTTSNVMIRTSSGKQESEIEDFASTVLIDFGLSSVSSQPEDKAVDLYVLERAFQATHPQLSSLFEDVLQSYASSSGKKNSVIKRLEEGKMI
ncbi:TP53 regulating kinase, variant 2 [Entomophthora muscae]|uniref:TP53 regulating kinase, variant 2 n=1 Tax=Entomophthora muscae TaxID=34485 RepID=A0ACC2T1B4_9FUNG|nr:TP53 regulating kinase, variant 2 [Entomophthora muscae]